MEGGEREQGERREGKGNRERGGKERCIQEREEENRGGRPTRLLPVEDTHHPRPDAVLPLDHFVLALSWDDLHSMDASGAQLKVASPTSRLTSSLTNSKGLPLSSLPHALHAIVLVPLKPDPKQGWQIVCPQGVIISLRARFRTTCGEGRQSLCVHAVPKNRAWLGERCLWCAMRGRGGGWSCKEL